MQESDEIKEFVQNTIKSIREALPSDLQLKGNIKFDLAVIKVEEKGKKGKVKIAEYSKLENKEFITRIQFKVGSIPKAQSLEEDEFP